MSVHKVEHSKKADESRHHEQRVHGGGGRAAERARGGQTASQASGERFERDEDDDHDLRVATFNVAGGSESHHGNFEGQTSDHLADVMVDENVDVATMQEVYSRQDGLDYNQEVLLDLAERGLPQGAHLDRDHPRYLDGEGRPIDDPDRASSIAYTVRDEDGAAQTFTIGRESVDAQGDPLTNPDGTPRYRDGSRVTVYSGSLTDERTGETSPGYTVVFGATARGKHHGNSVVLAPGNELQRDANGALVPQSIRVEKLGDDPDDGENRAAVGVTFETRGGETAHAISAHATNQRSEVPPEQLRTVLEQSGLAAEYDDLMCRPRTPDLDAQREDLNERILAFDRSSRLAAIDGEYARLQAFAQSFGGNTVIGADLNSTPGEQGLPSARDMGFHTAGLEDIDQILVSRGSHVDRGETRGEGGSDHPLAITDVDL